MSKTESFEQAMDFANTVVAYCDIPLLDRLQAAHDREIRDTAQQEYHRGYNDGRHSMDAEHRAVAMRLRALTAKDYIPKYDIARAVYGDIVWSGVKLCNKLIELMGGVSDENVHVGGLRCDDGCMGDVSNGEDTGRTHDSPSNRDRNHMAVRVDVDTVIGDGDDACDSQCGGACADSDGRDSGEHAEVSDGRTADDSPADSRGRTGGELVHMDGLTTYDVLDNERRKAVCELRNMKIDSDYYGNYQRIALAIGTVYDGESFASECVRDRLIHLIGGDKPSGIDVLRAIDAESDTDGTSPNDDPTVCITDELLDFIDVQWPTELHETAGSVPNALLAIASRMERRFAKALISRGAELECYKLHINQLEAERDKLREELDELRGHSRTCTESGGDVSESAPSVSITDELREWASDRHCKGISHTDVLNIGLIADRIDEQFDRICQQQEAVLQDTIDELQQTIDDVVVDRDSWKTTADMWKAIADDMGRERAELRDEDVKIKRQYAKLCVERADLLDLLRDARDEYKTLDRVSSETSANFHAMRDRVWGAEMERDELQAKLDEYERTHMKLPRDKDGICINVSDTVRINDREYGVYAVSNRKVWLNPFDDDLYRLYGYPADECKVVKKRGAING